MSLNQRAGSLFDLSQNPLRSFGGFNVPPHKLQQLAIAAAHAQLQLRAANLNAEIHV